MDIVSNKDKLTMLLNKYNASEIVFKKDYKVNVKIFDDYIEKDISNLIDNLIALDNIINITKEYNEKITSINISKNQFWITIQTFDNKVFTTNILGYKKRLIGYKALIKCVFERNHKLLSSYVNSHEKVLIDYNCGHPPKWVSANHYISANTGCSVCSQKIVIPYVNDVYTIAPKLHRYFNDTTKLIGLGISDKKKLAFICPECKQTKYDSISNVYSFGFSCPTCSDGISYSEKFMANVLKQLNIDFKTQQSFDWCVFYYDGDKKFGRYDFYIPSLKLIIEMDGGFHYEDGYYKTKEYSKDIDEIKDKLANNNGLNVIRINCHYNHMVDRFKYIKTNIIKELSHIFDLSKIDWNIIEKNNLKSSIIYVCNLWNEGLSILEIMNIVHLCKDTICQYLRQGVNIGLCDYSKFESQKRTRKYNKERRDL